MTGNLSNCRISSIKTDFAERKMFFLFIIGWLSVVSSTKPICTSQLHTNGSWVYSASKKKSFICCGYDPSHYGFTLDYQIPELQNVCHQERDSEVYFNFTAYDSPLLFKAGGHSCSCDSTLPDRKSVSEREKWVWEPSECELLSWNAERFCSLLGSRKILLVGDSTMLQTSMTLINMILTEYNNKEASSIVPSCVSQISYFRDELLTWEAVREGLRVFSPNLLILNAGPHHNDLDQYKSHMKAVLQDLHSLKTSPSSPYAGLSVLWKTINPGHLHCETFSTPITEKPQFDVNQDRYRWRDFEKFDEFMMDLISHYSSVYYSPTHIPLPTPTSSSSLSSSSSSSSLLYTSHYSVLNLSPLYYRPDAHPSMLFPPMIKSADCLHFCMPGPLDLFSQVLLNWLYHNPQQQQQ